MVVVQYLVRVVPTRVEGDKAVFARHRQSFAISVKRAQFDYTTPLSRCDVAGIVEFPPTAEAPSTVVSFDSASREPRLLTFSVVALSPQSSGLTQLGTIAIDLARVCRVFEGEVLESSARRVDLVIRQGKATIQFNLTMRPATAGSGGSATYPVVTAPALNSQTGIVPPPTHAGYHTTTGGAHPSSQQQQGGGAVLSERVTQRSVDALREKLMLRKTTLADLTRQRGIALEELRSLRTSGADSASEAVRRLRDLAGRAQAHRQRVKDDGGIKSDDRVRELISRLENSEKAGAADALASSRSVSSNSGDSAVIRDLERQLGEANERLVHLQLKQESSPNHDLSDPIVEQFGTISALEALLQEARLHHETNRPGAASASRADSGADEAASEDRLLWLICLRRAREHGLNVLEALRARKNPPDLPSVPVAAEAVVKEFRVAIGEEKPLPSAAASTAATAAAVRPTANGGAFIDPFEVPPPRLPDVTPATTTTARPAAAAPAAKPFSVDDLFA